MTSMQETGGELRPNVERVIVGKRQEVRLTWSLSVPGSPADRVMCRVRARHAGQGRGPRLGLQLPPHPVHAGSFPSD